MIKPVQTLILAAAAVAAVAACASADPPPRGETVPLLTLAKNPEAWRGREVRTCGPTFGGNSKKGEWQLSMPYGRHGAGIYVLSCPGPRPARDSNGCISGRIARSDGSLEPIPEGGVVTVSDSLISYEWYLHAECRAQRRP